MSGFAISRRAVIGGGIALPLAAARAGPATLRPVDCRPGRIIRTLAGIRPYRPAGFVVRRERLRGRHVVHNYGHGGAGITLCWGTGALAVEHVQALARAGEPIAVIGCGVIGLATARLLQERGYRVTIHARDLPPDTTSNVAGGWWAPATLFEEGRQSADFARDYVRATAIAHRRFQTLANNAHYGVRWLPAYNLSKAPPRPSSTAFPEIERFYPDSRDLTRDEHPFPVPHVRRRWSMQIDTPIFLDALMRDVLAAGGRIEQRVFESARAITALDARVIVNCTGLGAETLFDDRGFDPVRGQLALLLPQPEIDYATFGPFDGGVRHMFPRRDAIVIGGTSEHGVSDATVDPDAIAAMIARNAEVFSGWRS